MLLLQLPNVHMQEYAGECNIRADQYSMQSCQTADDNNPCNSHVSMLWFKIPCLHSAS